MSKAHLPCKIITLIICCLSCIYTTPQVFAQTNEHSNGNNNKLIQLSGLLMANDSLQPVYFANVYNPITGRGTISDLNGYFSLVVHKGDTIHFSAMGYKDAGIIIPQIISDNEMSVIQFLQPDTVQLKTIEVHPWPTPENFKDSFLALELPDSDLKRAKRNLEREKIREMGEVLAYDGLENFGYQVKQISNQAYYAGQLPPNNLLNPLAWMGFIKAIKRGDFKWKRPDAIRVTTYPESLHEGM